MPTANQGIRDALRCPKCKRSGKVRPDASSLAGGAIRLACDSCGTHFGTFEPEDKLAWHRTSPADAVRKIQAFIDATELPEGAIDLLALVSRKDDRIEELEKEIRQIAQMTHQAYHGAHPPDLCDCTWEECPRGICRRAQHVLGLREES